MLISAVAALALFAAPEATQSGDNAASDAAKPAAAAEAKPVTRKVCYQSEVSGTRLPKKTCRTEVVKPKQEAEAKTATPAS